MITIFITCITFLSTFFALFHFLSSYRFRKELMPPARKLLSFSIVIPCYNEAPILSNTIAGVLKLNYSNFEVIFINDGSTDGTLDVLRRSLDLEDRVDTKLLNTSGVRSVMRSRKFDYIYVIDKENSGKADSLNKGIHFCHNELVVTLDGDCVLEKDALQIMNQVFQEEDIIASGGAVHVMQVFLLNKKSKFILKLQALDYIKGFYIYKPALAYNNALNIISGAFGVFRKDALLAVDGFRNGLGEDIDVTLRLQEYALKQDKRITYNAHAVCYTECPETMRSLSKQRTRWQKAFLDAFVNNRSFLFRCFAKANVCFFMVADAMFSGTMAVLSFLINYILIATKVIYGFGTLYLIYITLAVLFNVVNSLVALKRAKKLLPKLNILCLIAMIFPDIVLFSLLRIGYFLQGTVSYCLNNRKWNKIERTSNCYHI